MNLKEDTALLLRVEGLHKAFDDRAVLAGATLKVPKGSLVSVLGRSGTGKSVFLKCLANVLEPDAGEIYFDGRLLAAGDRVARTDFRKRSGFLFQSNALFDSMTALENVALPLEQTMDLSAKEVRERSLEALSQLELEEFKDRFPSELSGGMQKRLALARALVTKPELVLFDEPTAGLDPLRRNAVFLMIAKYQRQFNFSALVVTHDVPEALACSDRVAMLEDGTMCFEGTPEEFSVSPLDAVRNFRDSTVALGVAIAGLGKRNDGMPV
ncbi:ATP-binding cassette domain-containing protein [Phragmitibacter flavus]|uniref:ATP-binding cassette domain-containing protein n=1 Tax=Phragmitibacter flavus TaxID=2576071 RepID=A0A5R8KBU2_9BACT|nr:ATP-binding cassette domain-containing protein [Phragmitibacter flavus]TLD69405.1 ATP-binding cassette domain-containing protein [Phragmitibacter flavus]